MLRILDYILEELETHWSILSWEVDKVKSAFYIPFSGIAEGALRMGWGKTEVRDTSKEL